MAEFYRELVKILRENGFTLLRSGKGSHEIWHSRKTGRHAADDEVTTYGK